MAEPIMVGMAEVKICSTSGGVLVALGLGSCIGICAFDPDAGVAGLSHVVLPSSGGQNSSPGKFADTAVPLLIESLQREGASPRRLRIALVGGAQLFNFNGANSRLEIGARNIEAVKAELAKRNYRTIASDLGGNVGRTVHFFTTGRITVKSMGQGEKELVNLAKAEREFAGLRVAA